VDVNTERIAFSRCQTGRSDGVILGSARIRRVTEPFIEVVRGKEWEKKGGNGSYENGTWAKVTTSFQGNQ